MKKPLLLVLNFFCFQWHFDCFIVFLKCENIYLSLINLIIINESSEKISMLPIVSLKKFSAKKKYYYTFPMNNFFTYNEQCNISKDN